ncbi:MAG: rhodanese-like domain-containing protein [Legionella sp.]|nr:rhodanese-like domain-containing protein [Legionella sp.]
MTAHKIATIDVHELKKRLDNDPSLCLIDVREQDEWDEGHIPGATHIPKDELPAKIDAKASSHQQPIYLHCKGGVRSAHSAERLMDMGYKEVYSVTGGIAEWARCGYEVRK